MRVLVCGGRDYKDYPRMCAVLNSHLICEPHVVIIHGCAHGADALANRWALAAGAETAPFPADWDTHGKSAGPIRNQRMIDEGKPDLVIAFPGGRGTADMVERAESAGIRVVAVGGKERPRSKTPDNRKDIIND